MKFVMAKYTNPSKRRARATYNHREGTIRTPHTEWGTVVVKTRNICIPLQYLQGLVWTSLEQFLQATEVGPPHPIAFHHEPPEP